MGKQVKVKVIKKYLENGGKVTDLTAWKLCKTFRLSAIIYELRHRYNMNIQDEWVTNLKTNTRYKQYWLDN